MKRWKVECEIVLDHERGPEPTAETVSQAVADRLGDGAFHVHVEVAPGPDAEDGDTAFSGARLVPVKTAASLAEEVPPVWMVEGVPIERGHETPTYGPFATREEAEAFCEGPYERFVYNAVTHPRGGRS